MLGGGKFLSQNKILPGTYINFVSSSNASVTLSDRGIVAIPLSLDWGIDGEVFGFDAYELSTNSLKILGYTYDDDNLKGIRDVFKNAKKLYVYRVNSGEKATCTYATAKYSGVRGNDIKIVIANSTNIEDGFVVTTLIATTKGGSVYTEIDSQEVATAASLVDNDFVTFKTSATLAVTAGTALTGGTNLTNITGTQYQTALDKFESYSFNTLGCLATTETIKALFVEYTKRMRDEVGAKFQCVVYNYAADYEGVINLKNKVSNGNSDADLVYWVTGAVAGCAVNKSNTNKTYDGEYTVDVDYTQTQLEQAIKSGVFILHNVNGDVNILKDINSFVSTTAEKGESFSSNQVIRVLDQIANDVAIIFNTKYLGKVQNNASGRASLWNDIVTYNKKLETLEAIEDFNAEDVVVEISEDKTAVVVSNIITPVYALEKIYMTVVVQ